MLVLDDVSENSISDLVDDQEEGSEVSSEDVSEELTEDIFEDNSEEISEDNFEVSSKENFVSSSSEEVSEDGSDYVTYNYYYSTSQDSISGNYVTSEQLAYFDITIIFLLACVFGALLFNAFMKKL